MTAEAVPTRRSARSALAGLAGLACAVTSPMEARAALAPAELDAVDLSPTPGAALSGDVPVTDATGRSLQAQDLFGRRPLVLILADYRCNELCGPILSIASHALEATGLVAARDYDIVTWGIDPRATPGDAARMGYAELGALAAKTHLLVATPAATARVEAALGYSAAFDQASGRFAHPAAILVLMPNGTVSRVLPGLSVDPEALRLALVEAGEGRVGTFGDRLHLLCYGLDPAHGVANRAIGLMLGAGGLLTLAGLAAFLVALQRTASGRTASSKGAAAPPVPRRGRA